MKIQQQDMFHGAVFTQIVEHESFTALNRATPKYGHYLVNADRHIFVKYSKSKASPWQFTFSPDEFRAVAHASGTRNKVFVCLVCGRVTVCALTVAEIEQVIDIAAVGKQTVYVRVPSGGSCHIRGPTGELPRAIPHNSFPNKVLQ